MQERYPQELNSSSCVAKSTFILRLFYEHQQKLEKSDELFITFCVIMNTKHIIHHHPSQMPLTLECVEL
jgi:hypothetical protein